MPKFIVVTGGVLSGLGKGVAAAAIGNLVSRSGLRVVPIKCDGYLNVDPGTMNPIEHGEVFVLDDGGEVDMDFGHYERFLGIDCKSKWNLTMGKVYEHIRLKERRGDYLGKTVQMVPHVTDFIRDWFSKVAQEESADVVLIEVGGTVGDIENELYIEVCRTLKYAAGKENVLYVHLTYVPIPEHVGEQKSKPTQQSVAMLRSRGIQPDVIIGRSSERLEPAIKKKISIFCDIEEKGVISGIDVDNIYTLPMIYRDDGICEILKEKLGIESGVRESWEQLAGLMEKPSRKVKVAICGKYTKLEDSYASIKEALKHSGANLDVFVDVRMVDTEGVKNLSDAARLLEGVDGVIVPGGFGSRGIEGKILIIEHCRLNHMPFLGICYGMQLAIVEFARNVCNLDRANTTEVDERTTHPVIDILPEQRSVTNKGATMRLGAYPALLKSGSLVANLYQSHEASERHRHRYEVNPDYHEQLLSKGLVFSGMSLDGRLVEFMELPKHPFFVGTQAHPELKSRLESPAPLFFGLVSACDALRNGVRQPR